MRRCGSSAPAGGPPRSPTSGRRAAQDGGTRGGGGCPPPRGRRPNRPHQPRPGPPGPGGKAGPAVTLGLLADPGVAEERAERQGREPVDDEAERAVLVVERDEDDGAIE